MPERNDQDWVRALKQADEQALQEIWEKLFTWSATLAIRYGQDEDSGRDAAVHAYRRIMRHVDKFAFRGSFLGWCRQITVNEVKRRLPATPRFEQPLDDTIAEQLGALDPEPQLDEATLRTRLQPCLDQLSLVERQVIELFYFQGLTPQAIADQLGKLRNYVNQLAFRARASLRNCLESRGYHATPDVFSV